MWAAKSQSGDSIGPCQTNFFNDFFSMTLADARFLALGGRHPCCPSTRRDVRRFLAQRSVLLRIDTVTWTTSGSSNEIGLEDGLRVAAVYNASPRWFST